MPCLINANLNSFFIKFDVFGIWLLDTLNALFFSNAILYNY